MRRVFMNTAAAMLSAVCRAGAACGGYVFEEDFTLRDEKCKAYGIDVEENTSYSHGHARIASDGKYEILLNGNRHFLATPKLADFTLSLDYKVRPYMRRYEPGFAICFRWDREARTGDTLKVWWDGEDILHVLLNGRELVARRETRALFTDDSLRLEVKGGKGRLATRGLDLAFELEPRQAGHVAIDSTYSPSETLELHRVKLESDSVSAKKKVAEYVFELERVQGFQEPLRYDVSLERYETGETELSCRLSGTVRSRGERVNTGGREWGRIQERLTSPYLRVESPAGEYRNLFIYNGERAFVDPGKIPRNEPKLNDLFPWPLERTYLFRDFPEDFVIAAGYEHAIATPWRFAANGPYEQIRDKKGRLVYEGGSVRAGRIAVKAISPADKAITRKIPRDVPRYADALAHAQREHYFFESEPVRFRVETCYRDSKWEKSEAEAGIRFTTVFGEDLPSPGFSRRRVSDELAGAGLRKVVDEVELGSNPGCGVYKLQLSHVGADGARKTENAIFEVLSDDPNGPCPPLKSGLPFFVSMPNETKYLEQSAFDPWNFFGGMSHYYAVDNQYPAIGNMLQVWRVLPIYRRGWFCWSWNRNTDDYDTYDDFNRDLIRHSDYFGGADVKRNPQYRYEFSTLSFYTGDQLKLLRDFVAERRPPLKRLTLERLDRLVEANTPIGFDDLRDVFDTCWEDLLAYARPRIDRSTQEFLDYVWSVNPKVARASYGPYAMYVARYKTAYTLRYGGYPVEKDPRVRDSGSFWLFEEYHHSCDYPLYRAALFVASYDMHYGYGRKIYPEIYYSSWERCEDGAVFQAHPFDGGRWVRDSHQRRVAYQYAYGTPQFKDGRYRYWRDWGFHARNPDPGAMEEFIYAWGKMYRNQPVKSAKAPFIMLDLDQIALHGEFFDDQFNTAYPSPDGLRQLGDICNTAEEGLGYAYEKAVAAGYSTPVLSVLDDLDSITPEMADFVVLPPVVEGTPARHLAAVRRAHERGINLLCSEACEGLEDVFGVEKDPAGERRVGYVEGESFSHRLSVARHRAKGARVTLFGAKDAHSPMDIPLVFENEGGGRFGRAVFVGLPPACVRKNSFRQHYHWGSDSISRTMRRAMEDSFAFLAPDPSVKAERGNAIASWTQRGELVVILLEDSPLYFDTASYPATFRVAISVKGIGDMELESDAKYAVVSREKDRLVLRVATEKDTAYFLKATPPAAH